jgi:hypothetical protein
VNAIRSVELKSRISPNPKFFFVECLQVDEGIYDIEAEVCTPPEEQLRQNIPDELQQYVASGQPV